MEPARNRINTGQSRTKTEHQIFFFPETHNFHVGGLSNLYRSIFKFPESTSGSFPFPLALLGHWHLILEAFFFLFPFFPEYRGFLYVKFTCWYRQNRFNASCGEREIIASVFFLSRGGGIIGSQKEVNHSLIHFPQAEALTFNFYILFFFVEEEVGCGYFNSKENTRSFFMRKVSLIDK